MMQKLGAEFLGTFTLVFVGLGAAIIGDAGILGVALAFGMAVTVMAYAIGHISGGHYNPAVTIGLAVNCRFSWKEVIPYILAQTLGALAGVAVLSLIASGKAGGYDGMFGANGFGEHSPGGYGRDAAMLTEILVTALFVIVVLGATSSKAISSFAPLAIGIALFILHLVAINVTNASINPARSTGAALIAGGWAGKQLWLFWVAPILGAVLGGYLYKWAICCGSCGTSSCATK
jgi:aquaporin Z